MAESGNWIRLRSVCHVVLLWGKSQDVEQRTDEASARSAFEGGALAQQEGIMANGKHAKYKTLQIFAKESLQGAIPWECPQRKQQQWVGRDDNLDILIFPWVVSENGGNLRAWDHVEALTSVSSILPTSNSWTTAVDALWIPGIKPPSWVRRREATKKKQL